MTRYHWGAGRKAEGFPITAACPVAGMSRQAFSDWLARRAGGPSRPRWPRPALVAEIRQIHAELDGAYGEQRITPSWTAEAGW